MVSPPTVLEDMKSLKSHSDAMVVLDNFKLTHSRPEEATLSKLDKQMKETVEKIRIF